MKHYFILYLFLFISCKNVTDNFGSQNNSNQKKAISEQCILDGQTNDPMWQNTSLDFNIKNVSSLNSGNLKSNCKLTFTKDSLYFCFYVEDHSLILRQDHSLHHAIGSSDKVELFFSTDSTLSTYYGLEIDIGGRIEDFKAHFPKKINFEWSVPDDKLAFVCRIYKKHYVVEGRVALDFLKDLDLINDQSQLFIGLFTADFLSIQDRKLVNWKSWVDFKEDNTDFHQPKYFRKISTKKTDKEALTH